MTEKSETLSNRQLKSIKTHEKLLEAAGGTFIEQGFQKTTITQIIKKAETGYGTAYVHFKNKDDILIELMEGLMNRFYEIAEIAFRPSNSQEAEKLIRKQVRMFLEMAKNEQHLLKVVEEAIGQSIVVQTKWSKIREQFIERIAQDIAYSQEHGLAYQDVDPYLVSRGWFFSNEMYLWEIVRNEHSPSVDQIVHNLTIMYVRGLYK